MRSEPVKYTILHSLKNQCPRCRSAKVWISSNPYRTFFQKEKMHKHCSCCNLKFEKETGFWYGAMYVGYGINVAVFIGVFLTLYLIGGFEMSTWIYLGTVSLVSILLAPINFFLSRLIWLNLFVR